MEGARSYSQPTTAPAFLSTFDMELTAQRAPSFTKLQRDLAALVG